MLGELNKIRNGDFSNGVRKPTGWTWLAQGDQVEWRAMPSGNGDPRGGGIAIHSACDSASGLWMQSFRPRKDQHYRIEAVVSCTCDDEPGKPNKRGGLTLSLSPYDTKGNALPTATMAPLRRAQQFTLRSYYKAPPSARRVELRIGLVDSIGGATIHDVRVVPILEPESKSHPWAIPPLAYSCPPPVTVQSICVCTDAPTPTPTATATATTTSTTTTTTTITASAPPPARERPIVDLLRAGLGDDAVTVCSARTFRRESAKADAVLLLDSKPPASCKTLAALKTLARERIVLVSLRAMEVISGGHLVTREVRQIDDPIHARVRYADFPTFGFALYDIIPFAARDDHSTAMRQRQFRMNKAFREYCATHRFEVLLESETDADATSEKPIALIHRTKGGAIIVLDVEPAEALPSSLDDTAPAVHLIFSALGATRVGLGQYATPARDGTEFIHHLRDVVERFGELAWADGIAPTDSDSPYLVTLGRDLDTVGMPLIPRPLVLLRSGLRGDDVIGAYGVMTWLKSMLRPAPFVSPYAKSLASEFRIAWMPLAAPLVAGGGWHAGDEHVPHEVEIDFEPGTVAAEIDITTTSSHGVRLVTPKNDAFSNMLAQVVPALAKQWIRGRYFYAAPPAGSALADRVSPSWRWDDLEVEVTTEPGLFDQPLHRSTLAAGGKLVRLEIPNTHNESAGSSIWQTEWIAQLLEMVTGLMMGLVVVNRDATPQAFAWPTAIADRRETATLRQVNAPDEEVLLPKRRSAQLILSPGQAVIVRNGVGHP